MSRRRLIPFALVVTALVAIAAVAAHGRPLSGSGSGAGPSMAFYSSVWTTFLVVLFLCAIATGIAAFVMRRRIEEHQRRSYQARTARTLALLLAAIALGFYVRRYIHLHGLLHPRHPTLTTPAGTAGLGKGHRHGAPQHLQFYWQELVIVLGVALVLAAAAFARWGRRPRRGAGDRAPEAVAAALDESLDDLRTDPDLRRAIVAAYARMESALAGAGVPRRPAEAPLEYL
jgi:cytochrome bd-type quinol oxidase subunit 2